MRSQVKLLLALVVTLPIAAYVVGAMVTTTPADQGPLPPVLMRDEVPPTNPAPSGRRHGRHRSQGPPLPRHRPPEDDDDEVRVVRPEPTRVDDDGGDGTDEERADDAGDDD